MVALIWTLTRVGGMFLVVTDRRVPAAKQEKKERNTKKPAVRAPIVSRKKTVPGKKADPRLSSIPFRTCSYWSSPIVLLNSLLVVFTLNNPSFALSLCPSLSICFSLQLQHKC